MQKAGVKAHVTGDKNAPVGRPPGRDSEQVRNALLKAAQEHFLGREFKAVSLRQIADSAGVNPAMVNYYFGSKQGLYLAMVDSLLSQLQGSLARLSDTRDGKGSYTIAEFSSAYTQLIAQNPWWPNFMAREVLFADGEIRDGILERFSGVFAPALVSSISAEIEEGNFREELDPQLTLISLLAMTVFPFLARPMMEQVMNIEMDENFAERLARHNTALFLHGVAKPRVEQ